MDIRPDKDFFHFYGDVTIIDEIEKKLNELNSRQLVSRNICLNDGMCFYMSTIVVTKNNILSIVKTYNSVYAFSTWGSF